METFAVFHKILYGELSPIKDSVEHHQEYLDYLRENYPQGWERHFKIRLARLQNGDYHVNHVEEFCFDQLASLIYQDEKTADPNELDLMIKSVVPQLGVKPIKITRSSYQLKEGEIHLELTIVEDYHRLSSPAARFYYYRVLLRQTVTNIQNHVHQEIFSFENEEKMRIRTWQYQILISAYLNTIDQDHLPKARQNSIFQLEGDYRIPDIFKLVSQHLDEILVFIERTFFVFLDRNTEVSYQQRLTVCKRHERYIHGLLQKLKVISLPPSLYNTLVMPLNNVLGNTFSQCTYHVLEYHEEYIVTLYRFFKNNPAPGEKIVTEKLYSLNFNTPKLFRYLTQKIKVDVKAYHTVSDKLMTLYYHQKTFNQLPVKTSRCYHPGLPTLKDQINSWLKEEIQYYERKSHALVKKSMPGPGDQ